MAVSTRSAARRLGSAGAVILGLVFLVATAAKAVDPGGFARQIAAEGLAFGLPAFWWAIFGVAAEAFVGVALLLAIRRPLILVPTGLFVAFFLFLTGRSWWRAAHGALPADASCGCFGNLVLRTPAEAFWQDAVLLVPAFLLAAFLPRPGGPAPRGRLLAAGLAALAAAAFAAAAPRLPLDDLATRLRPGVELARVCVGDEGEPTRVCLGSTGVLPEGRDEDVVVVLAALDDAFGAHVEELNRYHLAGTGPRLFVVTDASSEELFRFRFGHGPAFEIREAPAALLQPLYRTRPRSFRARAGVVVATWPGLPPLDTLGGGRDDF